MSEPTDEAKTRAIIAHITIIGWIIALVMNNDKKDEFASFYIRQTLGIVAISLGVMIINSLLLFYVSFLGVLLYLGVLAILIVSLISAINGEKKELPIVGAYFQQWFKSL